MTHFLNDHDVNNYLTPAIAVEAMRAALREQAAGTLEGPPRFHVANERGKLVFTAGVASGATDAIGFRVYNTFPQPATVKDEQVVVVYGATDGELRAIVVGQALGALRTAGLNGVALAAMARHDAKTITLIGAGYHARWLLRMALALRKFERVIVYSRTRQSAEKLAAEFADEIDITVADSAESAVRAADVLLCATNSSTPILDAAWIQPGTHINSMGPKTASRHELPSNIADRCDRIVSDSLAQIANYAEPFYLAETGAIVGLDQIVSGNVSGRQSDDEITLFVSTGLAGTEVVLANRLADIVSASGTKSAETVSQHRWHAVEANNRAWRLSEKGTRTPQDDDDMLQLAHTSAYHWSQIGTASNRALSDMLLGHVYALRNEGTQAVRYAARCHTWIMENNRPNWEIAFAHLILAHANAAAGEMSLHAQHYAAAVAHANEKCTEEEISIFNATLATVPSPH